MFISAINRKVDKLIGKIDQCVAAMTMQVELNKQVIKDLERLEEKVAALEKRP